MTYQQAIDYLYAVAPPFHQVGAAAYKPGLDTMRRLMSALGVQQSCPVIHVAGTNGKGSTSHLIASALAASGLKVGLYTSPHLVSFCERVRVIEPVIDSPKLKAKPRLVPESYVADFIDTHKPLFEQLQPSFFEITTAMAFCWLAGQDVDIAVIEVGLGGLLDATNIVNPVLTVITNIGLDHTDLLGSTLAEIATQKAGIIKPGVTCIVGERSEQTAEVFEQIAQANNAALVFADECEYLRRQRMRYAPDCELQGDYQQQNMQTAFVALRALCVPRQAVADGFAHVVTYTGLRGRWEILAERPLTICDTGHNSHGISTYIAQLQEIKNCALHIVFGMVADKDVDAVLRLLPAEAVYYFTQPDSHRALPAEVMLNKWQSLHQCSNAKAFGRVYDAFRAAQDSASPDDVIFIGGSNYVVGEVIKLFE